MPAGVPQPQAVLRGHKGEVQALDFDASERFLVSGDSLGEVRVWDLEDLRPAAIRRLHPLSGGILSLRLFRSAGRRLLGTQGRDGATLLWDCADDGDGGLKLSEEPARAFLRDCYSFCRFDALWADSASTADRPDPSPAGEGQQQHRQNGSAAAPDTSAAAQNRTHEGQQQEQGLAEEQLAEEFVAAVLADQGSSQASANGRWGADEEQQEPPAGREAEPAANGGAAAAAQGQAAAEAAAGGDSGAASLAASSPARSGPPSSAAVAAAIWYLHPCKSASPEEPPALLAIPGGDERTAEVVCAACGARVAEFKEAASGKKLGMLMAVQLYCWAGEASAGAAGAAGAGGGAAAAAAAGTAAAAGPPLTAADARPPQPRILLAAGYESGRVAVWEVGAPANAPPLAERQLCSEPVMALAIDSSAAGGAASSAKEQVVCFRIDYAGRRLRERHAIELRGKGQAGVGDVAIRRDRRLLATAGWDGRVRLYRYRSGRPLAVLKYHSSPATGLRFAPRSMALATAARDGTLALWPLYQPAEAEEEA